MVKNPNIAFAYAKVINEQIPVNKSYNHWYDLSKSVSLDNTTEPTGGGYSTFTVKKTTVKIPSASKSKKGKKSNLTTTKTTVNKPYYLTAHDYGLNIPKDAYIKSIRFTARMKASKGTKTVLPRGRIEVNGITHEVKESGAGKTGWHNGDYVVYKTGNFTTKWKDYTYELNRTNWEKGKFKVSNLNKSYFGLDLIFNDPSKAGTVYLKWVKVEVLYELPLYELNYSIKTDVNNPYVVNTGEKFDLTITCTQTSNATDSQQRIVLVDVPFTTEITSITPSNSTFEYNEDGDIDWAVDGKPHGVSKLKLSLKGYTRELHELISSNDYIGSSTFYYYNLPDDDDDYYVKLSTDPLRYGTPACVYVKVGLRDFNGYATFRLFEEHDTKQYMQIKSVKLLSSTVDMDISYDTHDNIILEWLPTDEEVYAEFKVCYRSPLQVGDGYVGITDDNDDDYKIPIYIDKPYKYVVSNKKVNDNDVFTLDIDADNIYFRNHRFPTITELDMVVLPLSFSSTDNTMIMSDCNIKMNVYEEVDYIGVVPLKIKHYDPKNSTTNDLLKEQYKNKVYMGKKGVIDESIDLNVKVSPQQATTLQGLVKLDKPTPINAIHSCFDGDTLNHRGWAEMHGINIEKTNPLYYDVSLDVTYITHDINTKFNIKRDNRIIDLTIPSVLSETLSPNENLSYNDYFTVDTDGTFSFEEEAEDGLGNIFNLQNGQYFKIKSMDKLNQETEISFSWISNKLTEDKENKIYREIKLVDDNENTIASLVYHDLDLSNTDYITAKVLLTWDNGLGSDNPREEEITLRSDVDIDEFADDSSEETLSIEDILDDDFSVDDLFGSTVHFHLNNGVLSVIDEGFNGKEFVQEDIKLSSTNLYLVIDFHNLNDEADDTEITCFTSLSVMETVLDTKYSEQYGDLVVAPFPVTDTSKQLLFTREGEEGTIYYYKDDGGNFKYLLEPYYQYNNGVDLRTSDGISVFDLDNSYTAYEIQNGLIGLGFNKINGDVWLSKYDLQSKDYITTHYFNLGEDVKFTMPPISDDRIDLMANGAVFTVFRGRPYVLVKHQDLDLKILTPFEKVWAEKVGGEAEDFPVIFDLLNSDNQLPPKVGGNTSISADDLELTEVETDTALNTTVSLTVPQTVEANNEATFPITTSIESSTLYELIDLGYYEGVFGTYESNVQTNHDIPYSIYLSKYPPITKVNSATENIETTVSDFDKKGIANKLVATSINLPNIELDSDITDVPILLDSFEYDSSTKVYDVGLSDLGVDLSDKDFVFEYDYTPQGNGSVLLIGAKSQYSVSSTVSNYRVGIGIWTGGELYYTQRTTSSTNQQTSTMWALNTTKHCKIVKVGSTASYYCDGVLLGTLTIDWWSNYHEFAIYGYSWNRNGCTIENVVLKYEEGD